MEAKIGEHEDFAIESTGAEAQRNGGWKRLLATENSLAPVQTPPRRERQPPPSDNFVGGHSFQMGPQLCVSCSGVGACPGPEERDKLYLRRTTLALTMQWYQNPDSGKFPL